MFLLKSWNRNGHKILSAATDNVVSVWDVLTGECDKSFRFPSPVLKVQFHPRDRYGLFSFHPWPADVGISCPRICPFSGYIMIMGNLVKTFPGNLCLLHSSGT